MLKLSRGFPRGPVGVVCLPSAALARPIALMAVVWGSTALNSRLSWRIKLLSSGYIQRWGPKGEANGWGLVEVLYLLTWMGGHACRSWVQPVGNTTPMSWTRMDQRACEPTNPVRFCVRATGSIKKNRWQTLVWNLNPACSGLGSCRKNKLDESN